MDMFQVVFGKCPHCKMKISKVATRCPHCTSSLVTKKTRVNRQSPLDADYSLPPEENEKFGSMMGGIFLGYGAWGLYLYLWPNVSFLAGAVTFFLFPIIGIIFTSNSNKN